MKKGIKKIGALIISAVMIMSLSATAFADTTLDGNGEQGAFQNPDTPVSQDKTLVLSKEITAYNLDETTINAPTISYTYTIGAATVATGSTVTDAAAKHTSDTAVTAPVKAGIVSATAPSILNSGVVSWTPAETLTASTDGTANKKDISIDFSGVIFTGPGIYRYAITEALSGATDTYAASGVTETELADNTKGSHVRYIDVYVRPSTETDNTKPSYFTDGSTAAQWDIYGYTCFYNNAQTITDANKTTVPVKTTGFVSGTTNGTTVLKADSYYTYNLTLSKTVVNDGYAAANVAFPFTVLFTNDIVTKNVDIIGNIENATVTGYTDPAMAAPSAGTTNGIVNIKSGGQIKYIGIPNGTSVEVYETNTVTGVTYKVDTAVTRATVTTTTDNTVVWGDAPQTAVAQAAQKPDYQSTKATITTTADQDDDNDYTVAITNTLVTISPTGVIIRVAPYALLLGAGAVLFVLSRRGKRKSEEEA